MTITTVDGSEPGSARDFDADEFLRKMAGYVGLGAGTEYAVGFRRYPMG